MPVAHEWVVEELEVHEDERCEGHIVDWGSDVCDVNHFDHLSDALAYVERSAPAHMRIALIRDLWHTDGGLESRQYAYLRDDKLETKFDEGDAVPQKFHAEVAKALA